MKTLMLTFALAILTEFSVMAQTNPGNSPFINGSGTYAPLLNPASGQSNRVIGTPRNTRINTNTSIPTGPLHNTTGTFDSRTFENSTYLDKTYNNTTYENNTYRHTVTNGISSDSLSPLNINSAPRRTNPINPTLGTQSGTVNPPPSKGTTGVTVDTGTGR